MTSELTRTAAPAAGLAPRYPAALAASTSALVRLSWARTVSPLLALGMLALIALPVIFAVIFAAGANPKTDLDVFLVREFDGLVCTVVTPLIALLLGTSAFSAESEDGTLLYLVTTTTPRWWISTVRVLFAALLTALLSGGTVALAGAIATRGNDPTGLTRAFTVAVAFGGATYAALFTALSLLTRRALVSGLGYVLFWEGIMSVTFPGVRYLSVHQWMLSIANALSTSENEKLMAAPSVTASVVGAAVISVLACWIGGRKLNRPRIARTM